MSDQFGIGDEVKIGRLAYRPDRLLYTGQTGRVVELRGGQLVVRLHGWSHNVWMQPADCALIAKAAGWDRRSV